MRISDWSSDVFSSDLLDVTEGAGRQLQFTGEPCILDVYYYAPTRGAKPLATHVDARARDGRAADADRCIAALRRWSIVLGGDADLARVARPSSVCQLGELPRLVVRLDG